MKEASNVVSSPKWQPPSEPSTAWQAPGDGDPPANSGNQAAADGGMGSAAGTLKSGEEDAGETRTVSAASDEEHTSSDAGPPADTSERAATNASAPAPSEADGTAALTAAPEDDMARGTADSPGTAPASEDVPMLSAMQQPLMMITTACAVALGLWSYTTLEVTRSQLADVSKAKANVEQALKDAQTRLTTAEKTVADVKAALSGMGAVPASTIADPMR